MRSRWVPTPVAPEEQLRSDIRFFRVWETIFMLIVYEPVGTLGSFGLNLGFSVALGTRQPPNPTTAIIGYAFAAVGTWYQRRTAPKALLWLSAGMALTGFASGIGECVSYATGHEFRLVAYAGILQLLVDWTMFQRDKKLAGPAVAKR